MNRIGKPGFFALHLVATAVALCACHSEAKGGGDGGKPVDAGKLVGGTTLNLTRVGPSTLNAKSG